MGTAWYSLGAATAAGSFEEVGMGTSTRWPGPRGGVWLAPNMRLGRVDTLTARGIDNGSDDGAIGGSTGTSDRAVVEKQQIRAIEQVVDALNQTLRADPDAFGLRQGLIIAGTNLIDVLDDLSETGLAAFGLPLDAPADMRETAIVQELVVRVCGAGATPTDSVIRRAVVRCGRAMLQDDRFARGIENADIEYRMSGVLLCEIYQLFFVHVVEEFIKSVVAAKITLWFPVVQVIDPSGVIADWVASNIVGLIPSPCDETGGAEKEGTSLADLARGLLEETVRRVLGLSTDEMGGS
ncbi:hypothetical protein HLB23_40305 [Nocardia uniformis]|uniref:Uncharacterized protein n=2 Tax=Nocardia uniformis TaxID=53432 RepID=A0A849CBL2_9NOCA|nr:hypothetical protein [Nocardia uniformis]